MTRDIIFSPCRTYRYTLWREWIGGSMIVAASLFSAKMESAAVEDEAG